MALCPVFAVTTTQSPQGWQDDGVRLVSDKMNLLNNGEFNGLLFASQILFVTMCCFCSVPLTHISVEEHVSFFILIHSANLLSICACVSVSVWDVTVRMGRGCDNKRWWQRMQSWIPVFCALWFLSGKRETEGTDVSFPTVRKLLIQGKGKKGAGKCLEEALRLVNLLMDNKEVWRITWLEEVKLCSHLWGTEF